MKLNIILFTTEGCANSRIMQARLLRAVQFKSNLHVQFATLDGLCDVKIYSLNNSKGREIARLYGATDAPTILCPDNYNKRDNIVGVKTEYYIRNWIREQLIKNSKFDDEES